MSIQEPSKASVSLGANFGHVPKKSLTVLEITYQRPPTFLRRNQRSSTLQSGLLVSKRVRSHPRNNVRISRGTGSPTQDLDPVAAIAAPKQSQGSHRSGADWARSAPQPGPPGPTRRDNKRTVRHRSESALRKSQSHSSLFAFARDRRACRWRNVVKTASFPQNRTLGCSASLAFLSILRVRMPRYSRRAAATSSR